MDTLAAHEQTAAEATARIAQHVAGANVAALATAAIEHAKLQILDTVGLMVAGSVETATGALAAYVLEQESKPECTIVGRAARASAPLASLVNGMQAHYHDYDDLSRTGFAHPSAALVPCLLTLGEKLGSSGADFLAAYAAGWEVTARVGEALGEKLIDVGWHTVGVVGTIACAAAAARLIGLDANGVATAIGIASSLAGGLKSNSGSDTKSLHAGAAASHGIVAAELAARGLSANREALDGSLSLGHLLVGDAFRPEAIDFDVSDLAEQGAWIKLHACNIVLQALIDAAIQLRDEDALDLAQIEAIEAHGPRQFTGPLFFDRPANALQGKFSPRYAVAVALLDGRAGIRQFSAESAARPELRALMDKVIVHTVPPPDDGRSELLESDRRVVVRLGNDRTLERTVRYHRGSTQNPATLGDVKRKYADCVEGILAPVAVARAAALIETIENVPSIAQLARALVGAAT